MPEFTQSWAFIFIVGVTCFIVGFVLATILAASGKASRAEERISDEAIYEVTKREEERRGGPETEIATRGNPEDA